VCSPSALDDHDARQDEESDAAVEQPPPLVLSAASDRLSAASNASDDASGSRPVTHAFIDRLHPALQHHYRHRAEPQRIMEASAGMASAGMESAAPASSDAPVAEAARRAERWRRQLVEPVAEAVPSSGEVATVQGAMVQRIEAGVADAVELAVKAAAARIEERMNAKVAAQGSQRDTLTQCTPSLCMPMVSLHGTPPSACHPPWDPTLWMPMVRAI
jgi:hypothetical protein